jgi:hypothetical protein
MNRKLVARVGMVFFVCLFSWSRVAYGEEAEALADDKKGDGSLPCTDFWALPFWRCSGFSQFVLVGEGDCELVKCSPYCQFNPTNPLNNDRVTSKPVSIDYCLYRALPSGGPTENADK